MTINDLNQGWLLVSWVYHFHVELPFGHLKHNCGTSPFSVDKSSMNGPFSIAMSVSLLEGKIGQTKNKNMPNFTRNGWN